ncbi:MAG: hypothetical protein ACXVRW_06725 [Solirubrobacteraceae bacterium]
MTPTSSATSSAGSVLGPAFADALARRDFREVTSVLSPDIDFVALTPRRTWEADTADDTVRVLREWFDDATVVNEVVEVRAGTVADRHCVTYRFAGERAGSPFVIEQHAYLADRDGRIGWMRLVCSGFRPHPDATTPRLA